MKYQTLIVEDDPYGDLYFGEAPPPSIMALSKDVPGSRELLAHCGSLSKVLSPGLRIGWMIAPAELLAKATMCKQFSDAHTSTFSQATAAQYLKSGRMPATLAHVREVYGQRAKAMGQALQRELGDAVSFTQPNGGLFFWARLTGAEIHLGDARIVLHGEVGPQRSNRTGQHGAAPQRRRQHGEPRRQFPRDALGGRARGLGLGLEVARAVAQAHLGNHRRMPCLLYTSPSPRD